jgi:hypothetical protein
MIRQVHSDIKIFAHWKAEGDRIQETLQSLIRVFGCLNYYDVNRARPVCNILFRGPSVALVPFTRAVSDSHTKVPAETDRLLPP